MLCQTPSWPRLRPQPALPGSAPPRPWAEKASASSSCFLLLPLPELVTGCISAAQRGPALIGLPVPGWVGGQLALCPLLYPLPSITSLCCAMGHWSLYLRHTSVPLSLLGRLHIFAFQSSVLTSRLQLPHLLPFPPLPPGVCEVASCSSHYCVCWGVTLTEQGTGVILRTLVPGPGESPLASTESGCTAGWGPSAAVSAFKACGPPSLAASGLHGWWAGSPGTRTGTW